MCELVNSVHVDRLSSGTGHGLPASALRQVKQVARLLRASRPVRACGLASGLDVARDPSPCASWWTACRPTASAVAPATGCRHRHRTRSSRWPACPLHRVRFEPAASMSPVIRHRVRAGEQRAGRQASAVAPATGCRHRHCTRSSRWPVCSGHRIQFEPATWPPASGLDVARDPSPRASW